MGKPTVVVTSKIFVSAFKQITCTPRQGLHLSRQTLISSDKIDRETILYKNEKQHMTFKHSMVMHQNNKHRRNKIKNAKR